jgi:hypothetical protein
MRALLILLASLGVAVAAHGADAGTNRLLKVLPFFLDQQGHIANSPSLFDRDAYQAFLRINTNKISGMRFDVLWKAGKMPGEKIRIALELRGVGTNSMPRLETLETNVVPGKYRQWTMLPLAGADYKNFGTVVAWRARLWNGDQMLSEQQSFLW